MDYPHFFYYPGSTTYIPVDTIQQLSRTMTSASQRYTRSSTGARMQITAKDLTSGSFECTFYASNRQLEWYLDFLVGKDVIFGYGPRDFASYVTIQSARVIDSPGNTLKVAFDVTFLGATRGHLRDAGDSRCAGGTLVTDTAATLNVAAKLTTQWDTREFRIDGNGALLPVGNYRLFARVKDTSHPANDVYMGVAVNGTSIGSATKTAKAYYDMYIIDFTISATYADKQALFSVKKATSVANSIYVDFLGVVAVP